MLTEKDYCVCAEESDIMKGFADLGRTTFKLLLEEELRLSTEYTNAKWYQKPYLKRKIAEYHKFAQDCAYATLALEAKVGMLSCVEFVSLVKRMRKAQERAEMITGEEDINFIDMLFVEQREAEREVDEYLKKMIE